MSIRILNWNAEANVKRIKAEKPRLARELIAEQEADIICLTEGFPDYLPVSGHSICSQLSGWGRPEDEGARKALLWCRDKWTDIDDCGAPNLPPGRFLRARTRIAGVEWTIYAMCIPWRNYGRAQGMSAWQGACEYLDALRQHVLPPAIECQRTILAGDFNLQIPPKNYPYPGSKCGGESVNRKREATFEGWNIPTAGEIEDPALDRRFIDHIALSPDIKLQNMRFVSRFYKAVELSDHNGVCIDLESDDPR